VELLQPQILEVVEEQDMLPQVPLAAQVLS
jgi:hypothetical protein